MDDSTRRDFLRDFGLGAAAFSARTGAGAPRQVPGQPGGSEGKPPRPSNLMAIAAHPGDGFFAMGTAVALATHLGGQGVFLSLSLGEKGSATTPPEQYGLLQRQAAERAAQTLDAHAVFLPYADGEIPVTDDAKFAVCDLIREYRPDVVVTHWRGSWHRDHRACYEIVKDAVFYAALPAIGRKQPAHASNKVFYAENWEDADGFVPDTYLDITPAMDRWAEACAVFPMWRGETGFRYNDYYRALSICRGCISSFKYAAALMSPPEQLVQHTHSL